MRRYFEMIKSQMKENRAVILAVNLNSECSKGSNISRLLLFSESGYLLGNWNDSETEKEIENYAMRLFCLSSSELCTKTFLQYNRWENTRCKIRFCFCLFSPENRMQVEMVNHFLLMNDEGSSGKLIVDTSMGKVAVSDRFGVILGDFTKEERNQYRSMYKEGNARVDERFFVEDISYNSNVYIFGGGILTEYLVPILHDMGYHCTVIDDNPEYTASDRHPYAVKRISTSYSKIAESVVIERGDAVLALTRGFASDEIIELFALTTQAGFIGALRDNAKKKFEEEWLKEQGADDAMLQRITDIKMGEMYIGAEDPYRIAVRIVNVLADYSGRTCTDCSIGSRLKVGI